MGNIENTAVNELIAGVSGGPWPAAGRAAAMAPSIDLPSVRTVRGLAPVGGPRSPGARPRVRAASTLDPMRTSAAIPPPAEPGGPPVAAPAAPGGPPAMAPAAPERLDPRRLYQWMHRPPRHPLDRERMVPTFQIRRRSEVRAGVGKLVFSIALLVSTGIAIGGYIAFGGDHGGSPGQAAAAADRAAADRAAADRAAAAPTPTEVAGPAPAATATAPVEVAAPPAPTAARGTGAPALVDVRIDSIPSGATVALVDRGRTQLVGDTPVDTAVDPSREYDLVFTYADQPPHVEHLDATTTRRIAAVLATRERLDRPPEGAPRRGERARDPAAGTRAGLAERRRPARVR